MTAEKQQIFNSAVDDAFKEAGVDINKLKEGDVITETQWSRIMRLMSRKTNTKFVAPDNIEFPISSAPEE